MKQLFYLASISSILVVVDSTCCYAVQSQYLFPSNFQYTLKLSSTKLLTTHKATITFPSDYISEINNSSLAKCTKAGTRYDCTTDQGVASLMFKLTTPTNPTGEPSAMVNIDNENCDRQATCEAPAKGDGGVLPDDNSGKVNLGALGYVEPTVFWPVIAGIIITFLGMGYLAYRRNHGAQNRGHDEEAMVASRNTAGWFGEDKGGDSAGYASYARKAGQATPAPVQQPKASKQRPTSSMSERKASELGSGIDHKRRSQLPMGSLVVDNDHEADDEGEQLSRSRSARSNKSGAGRHSSRREKPRRKNSTDDEKPLESKRKPKTRETKEEESDDSVVRRASSRRQRGESSSRRERRSPKTSTDERKPRREKPKKPLIEL